MKYKVNDIVVEAEDMISAIKLVKTRLNDSYSFKLRKVKNAYDEYVVRCYKDGTYYEDGSYYTDDWQDAVDTIKAMAKRANLEVKQNGNLFVADCEKIDSKVKDDSFADIFWGIYDDEYDLPFTKTIDYIGEKYGDKIWDESGDNADLSKLSSSEQRDIIEFAKKEALSWTNMDIFNSHARYKSKTEINNQLQRIFGIKNRNLHDSAMKDKSWLDLKEGDIITSDRLRKNRPYKVVKVHKDKYDDINFVTVQDLETHERAMIRADHGITVIKDA